MGRGDGGSTLTTHAGIWRKPDLNFCFNISQSSQALGSIAISITLSHINDWMLYAAKTISQLWNDKVRKRKCFKLSKCFSSIFNKK